MKAAPMGEVRNNFAKYLTACEGEPVFVMRNGKIAAVIEHLEDSDVEDFLLERSARFRAMLGTAKVERGGMSLKEYRKTRRIRAHPDASDRAKKELHTGRGMP